MAGILAAILGGILGAFVADEHGAVAGVVLGWLVLRSIRQQRRLDTLQQALDALRQPVVAAARSEAEAEDSTPVDVGSAAMPLASEAVAMPAAASDVPLMPSAASDVAAMSVASGSFEMTRS